MGMTWRIKQGELGRVLSGTLLDDDGPINLTGYTVTLSVSQTIEGTPLIANDACVIDPDQVANTGRISYTLTPTSSSLPVNEKGYYLEFTVVLPNGAIHKFPNKKSLEASYGRLVVRDSL